MPRSVFISAGHSTSPLEAGTRANDFKEEELTLELRDLIAAELRARDIPFEMDGPHGVSVPLTRAIVQAASADIAVEVHFNAGGAGHSGGFGLSTPSRKKFATALGVAVSKALGIAPFRAGWVSDTETRYGKLGFCRRGRGVVLEVCHQSNLDDMEAYFARKRQAAAAIAQVIEECAKRPDRLYDDALDRSTPRPVKGSQKTAANKRIGRRPGATQAKKPGAKARASAR